MMQGICFTDGFLEAVIHKNKTVTRRVIKSKNMSPKYSKNEIIYIGEPYILYNGNILYKMDMQNEKDKNIILWEEAKKLPYACARYFLKITNVYSQQIQDITVGDIIKEGFYYQEHIPDSKMFDRFKNVWNSIYTEYGKRFEDNPLVWVYEFELVNM